MDPDTPFSHRCVKHSWMRFCPLTSWCKVIGCCRRALFITSRSSLGQIEIITTTVQINEANLFKFLFQWLWREGVLFYLLILHRYVANFLRICCGISSFGRRRVNVHLANGLDHFQQIAFILCGSIRINQFHDRTVRTGRVTAEQHADVLRNVVELQAQVAWQPFL